jgi:hypothetical protein
LEATRMNNHSTVAFHDEDDHGVVILDDARTNFGSREGRGDPVVVAWAAVRHECRGQVEIITGAPFRNNGTVHAGRQCNNCGVQVRPMFVVCDLDADADADVIGQEALEEVLTARDADLARDADDTETAVTAELDAIRERLAACETGEEVAEIIAAFRGSPTEPGSYVENGLVVCWAFDPCDNSEVVSVEAALDTMVPDGIELSEEWS